MRNIIVKISVVIMVVLMLCGCSSKANKADEYLMVEWTQYPANVQKVYTYDEQGRKLTEDSGVGHFEYEYFKDGSYMITGWFDKDKAGFLNQEVYSKYDELIASASALDEFDYYYNVEYKTDRKGNILNKKVSDKESGSLLYTAEYEYGDNSLVIKENRVDGSNVLKSYEYDDYGNSVHETVDDGGLLTVIDRDYIYDDNGKIIHEYSYDNTGSSFEVENYYDSGLLTAEICRMNDNGYIYEYVNTYSYSNGENTVKSNLKTVDLFENIDFSFKVEAYMGSCIPEITINSGNPVFTKINHSIDVLNRTTCLVNFDSDVFELAKLGYINTCPDSYSTEKGISKVYSFDYNAHNIYGFEEDDNINEQILSVLDKTVSDYVDYIKVIKDKDDDSEYAIDGYEFISLDQDEANYMIYCGDKSYSFRFKHNLFVLPTGEVVCWYKHTLIGNYLGEAGNGEIRS